MILILLNFDVLFYLTYQKSEFSIFRTSLDDVTITMVTLRPQYFGMLGIIL